MLLLLVAIVFRLLAIGFFVVQTPTLITAQHFWGRSLRLLSGGGRSALYGDAPVARSMGCAKSLFPLPQKNQRL